MSRMIAARNEQQDQNRLAGRGLVWVDHGFVSAGARPVFTSTAGVSLQGADVAHVYINLRANPLYRQALITVTVDTSATYTISFVVGTDLSYAASGGDDAQAIATGLKAAIDGNAVAASLVDATVVNDGGVYKLQIRSDAVHGGDFYINKMQATGSGALVGVADRAACLFQVWTLPAGENAPQEWAYPVIGGTPYQSQYIRLLSGASTKLEEGKGPFVVDGIATLAYPLSVTGYSRIHVQSIAAKGPTFTNLESSTEPNMTYTTPTVKIGLALGD